MDGTDDHNTALCVSYNVLLEIDLLNIYFYHRSSKYDAKKHNNEPYKLSEPIDCPKAAIKSEYIFFVVEFERYSDGTVFSRACSDRQR